MCIPSVRLTLPFCDSSQEEETKCSPIMRAMAVGLGAIALIIGVLILCGIPGLSTLGTTGGSLFSACGGIILLAGVFLRCIKESGKQDRYSNNKRTGPAELGGTVDVRPQFKEQVRSAISTFHSDGDRGACDALFALAIQYHDDITLKYVIQEMKKGNVPIYDEGRRSIFHFLALDSYSKPLLDCLHNNGIEVPLYERNTILFAAVSKKNAVVIPILVKQFNIDPNVQDENGMSPLHHAILLNDLPCVQVLVEVGAKINLIDNKGQSPIDTVLQTDITKDPSIAMFLADKFPKDQVQTLRSALDKAPLS